jgi:hypothetical protein
MPPISPHGETFGSVPHKGIHADKSKHSRSEQVAQALVIAALYAIPALIHLRASSVGDPDIWWHLRTGEWIAQHHAVPRVDLFSSATMGKPWQAYSWLFDLLTFHLFHRLGFIGIVVYTMAMVLAISIALYHLFKRLQHDFTIGIVLTWTISLTLGRLYTPRPWLFSILFFIFEINILMQARRSGRLRELIWLPALFALWANLHIQFVVGLIVLTLALAESLLSRWSFKNSMRIPSLPLVITCLASLIATLLNPYGWHIYQTAHDLAVQPGPLSFVAELTALPFRTLSDYSVLFLAFAAVAALARSRRLLFFETSLFIFAAVVSFRSRRDLWIVAIVAGTILASAIEGRRTRQRLQAFAPLPLAVTCVALLLGSRVMHINNAELMTRLSNQLPVRAVAVAEARHYAGPVYTNYDWGGYLIWEPRLPVSIDGRAALHGDERLHRSQRTWSGEPGWDTDPQLLSAGLVVAPVEAPLTQLLRLDPNFKLTYEDQLAALFIPSKLK